MRASRSDGKRAATSAVSARSTPRSRASCATWKPGREPRRIDHQRRVLVAAEHEAAVAVPDVHARLDQPDDGLERQDARDRLRDVELVAHGHEREPDPGGRRHRRRPRAGRVDDDRRPDLAGRRRDAGHAPAVTQEPGDARERPEARAELPRPGRRRPPRPSPGPASRRSARGRSLAPGPGTKCGASRCASSAETIRVSMPSPRAISRSARMRDSPASVYAALRLPDRWNPAGRPVSRLEALERLAGLAPEARHHRKRGGLAREPGGARRRLGPERVLVDEDDVDAAPGEMAGGGGAEGPAPHHDGRGGLASWTGHGSHCYSIAGRHSTGGGEGETGGRESAARAAEGGQRSVGGLDAPRGSAEPRRSARARRAPSRARRRRPAAGPSAGHATAELPRGLRRRRAGGHAARPPAGRGDRTRGRGARPRGRRPATVPPGGPGADGADAPARAPPRPRGRGGRASPGRAAPRSRAGPRAGAAPTAPRGSGRGGSSSPRSGATGAGGSRGRAASASVPRARRPWRAASGSKLTHPAPGR